jgi:hypothetical protein
MHQAIQEGPGRYHKRFTGENSAILKREACDTTVLRQNSSRPTEHPLDARSCF